MQYAAVSLWWPVNKHGCRHFAHLMKYLATENDTAVHKTTVQYTPMSRKIRSESEKHF